MMGFFSNEDENEGYPDKSSHFTVIGLSSVKTVADTAHHSTAQHSSTGMPLIM